MDTRHKVLKHSLNFSRQQTESFLLDSPNVMKQNFQTDFSQNIFLSMWKIIFRTYWIPCLEIQLRKKISETCKLLYTLDPKTTLGKLFFTFQVNLFLELIFWIGKTQFWQTPAENFLLKLWNLLSPNSKKVIEYSKNLKFLFPQKVSFFWTRGRKISTTLWQKTSVHP